MPAELLSGRVVANQILQEIANKIQTKLNQGIRPPCLAVILIGEDPASEIYVQNKLLASKKVGIISKYFRLKSQTTESELLQLIAELNHDNAVDGILVQLPLPPTIPSQAIIEAIRVDKDVDGFHPYNLGRLAQKCPNLKPCTPAGIMKLLETTKIDLKGLNAVVVGVSNIVGRPMILELLMAGCTVTAAHSQTKDLQSIVSRAELLVVATGTPGLIKGEWIKSHAIVVDVGMNRLNNGKLVGDVEFEEAKKRAGWITPVPGGVGPMTVATLLSNTLYAYEALHLGTGSIGTMES